MGYFPTHQGKHKVEKILTKSMPMISLYRFPHITIMAAPGSSYSEIIAMLSCTQAEYSSITWTEVFPTTCMGIPIWTLITPGFLRMVPAGQQFPALWMIGSAGVLAFTASIAPPLEKFFTVPGLLRVPSGKITTERPSLSLAFPWISSDLAASRGFERSIAIGFCNLMAQPQKGIFNSSFFKMGQTGDRA